MREAPETDDTPAEAPLLDRDEAVERIRAVEALSERRTTPIGNGGDMVWHVWGAAREGERPALVLLHGGYGSWIHWIRNVLPLSERFTVYAADLPGLGDSDPPPDRKDPWGIGEIVARGIETVVPDGQRYHLVGFSFGSVMGSHAALHLSERCRGLTLVGGGGMGLRRAEGPPLVPLRPEMDEASLQRLARRNLEILMVAKPETVDAVALHMQITNTMRAVTKSRWISRGATLREVLPKVRTRLSGLWGARDSTAHPYLAEREAFLRAIQPDLDFRVVPDAGHWVQYEAAEAFNATIADMVTRNAAQG